MQELFTTKSLTYLPTPNRQTLQLIKEFEQLQGVERTEEQETRYQELLKEEPVAQEIRFTLGTVNALQQAYYQSYLLKARSWFQQESGGMLPSDFIEDVPEDSESYPYLFGLLRMSHAWAGIVASLRSYETRDYPLFAKIVNSEWKKQTIPTEWKTLEGFLSAIPTDLLWTLEALANEANPNLWHVPGDEESKKFGVMSVT